MSEESPGQENEQAALPEETPESSGDSNDRTLIFLAALCLMLVVGWITVKDQLVRGAAESGRVGVVKVLTLAGADLNSLDPQGQTALGRAALQGDRDLVQTLIDSGADINGPDLQGITPLASAVYGGHSELVSLLLEAGADVSVQDREGWTPLMAAVLYDNSETIKTLIGGRSRSPHPERLGSHNAEYCRIPGKC